jgi:outer membrane receptor protein involved in Fe transport
VVQQSVKEAAIEVEVPLIRDLPLFKSLDVNGAARYTDYSTSGKYGTWKVGRDIKLRATLSRDIRAPTLYDLYQPAVTVNGNYTDVIKPYYNSAATSVTTYLPSINVGNADLKAEVARPLPWASCSNPRSCPASA